MERLGESKWEWQVQSKWNALFDNTDFGNKLPAPEDVVYSRKCMGLGSSEANKGEKSIKGC